MPASSGISSGRAARRTSGPLPQVDPPIRRADPSPGATSTSVQPGSASAGAALGAEHLGHAAEELPLLRRRAPSPASASRRSMQPDGDGGQQPVTVSADEELGVGDPFALEGRDHLAHRTALGRRELARSRSGGCGFFAPPPSPPPSAACEASASRGFASRDPGIASRSAFSVRERALDQLLAELVRLLAVDQEPAQGRLADLEPIVRGPIAAGGLADELVGVGGRIGRALGHALSVVADLRRILFACRPIGWRRLPSSTRR